MNGPYGEYITPWDLLLNMCVILVWKRLLCTKQHPDLALLYFILLLILRVDIYLFTFVQSITYNMYSRSIFRPILVFILIPVDVLITYLLWDMIFESWTALILMICYQFWTLSFTFMIFYQDYYGKIFLSASRALALAS